jgi:hypothetical protein
VKRTFSMIDEQLNAVFALISYHARYALIVHDLLIRAAHDYYVLMNAHASCLNFIETLT